MKIISVVGARPNFMKIAPFVHAIERHNARLQTEDQRPQTAALQPIEHVLVHTGQHYDERMSKSFFDALDIPHPDIDLEVGSGSHAEQVGRTMIAFEKVLKEHQPDWVVVVGDVNATCACSITAKKEHIKVAHIEAGLRSFDMEMPEEINRLVTDRLSDLLLTPDEMSSENLRKEGVPEEKIKFVGNIMIDTLEAHREAAAKLNIETILKSNALPDSNISAFDFPISAFALMTMHRPSNVDKQEILEPIINFLLGEVCADQPLIWAIHPRAEKQLKTFGLWERVTAAPNLALLHPLSYHEMLRLNMDASLMLTDSGGLQEECCVLGTPCMTLRWNTERPITLREHGGASVLVGNAIEALRREYATIRSLDRTPQRPPLWDGHTADRIINAVIEPSH
jgi:UDP-N-acetylglucosamine 2-epimerase (non-hydrolysing)